MAYQEKYRALKKLEIRITRPVFLQKKARHWRGTDVIITDKISENQSDWIGSQPIVISFQSTAACRRLVCTPHASSLSLLFYRIRDIFYDSYDYVNKYELFGRLAQAALDAQSAGLEAQILRWVVEEAYVILDTWTEYGIIKDDREQPSHAFE